MNDLIEIINRLQSVFKTTGGHEVHLPQIVVVGGQSTGKSSVLESLVGHPFLPRGTGIVTRCPLILQLNKTDGGNEYCRFTRDSSTIFEDFDDVRRQVEAYQDIIAGDGKDISDEAIVLEFFSPNVLTLTVVDLPGIVKVPLPGQSADLEEKVYNMIRKYISNESAIILAVSPGNADIATSDSIKIAKEVDPDGSRTLSVITKLDILDQGTDAADVLMGNVVPVGLGIVGVVNRSQQDIADNATLQATRKKEMDILKDKYPMIAGIGSDFLSKRLSELLKQHIQKSLPALVRRIDGLMTETQNHLEKLGDEVPTETNQCCWIIMKTTIDFADGLRKKVEERGNVSTRSNKGSFPGKFHAAVARFRQEIANVHIDDLDEFQFPFMSKKKRIKDALRAGLNLEGYSSVEEVFKDLVRKQLELMTMPAITCAETIHELLDAVGTEVLGNVRFERLVGKLKDTWEGILGTQLGHVRTAVRDYIEMEKKMVYSMDDRYQSALRNTPQSDIEGLPAVPKGDPGNVTAFPIACDTDDDSLIEYVDNITTSYIGVITGQLADFLAKFIMQQLVDLSILAVPDQVKAVIEGKETTLLAESPEIEATRRHKRELLEKYKKAMEVIRGIRSSN